MIYDNYRVYLKGVNCALLLSDIFQIWYFQHDVFCRSLMVMAYRNSGYNAR